MWDVLALFPRFNNAKSQDGNALTFFVRCSRKKVPVLSFERKISIKFIFFLVLMDMYYIVFVLRFHDTNILCSTLIMIMIFKYASS